ncbi:piggyBac transposable element-derived protein 4-like [Strongylocentrotus purpuratus]|uniref:PiggyBac transposable element-derived protein domain-containing protein n=1 Tax=Strongylocentrotus purpuratus TaxID=7668 RepID=A0A7M7GI40_STRPU|nr:piggyBac transposable element-derived protein 4-like [Strongylocentrotus purpuratus]|eukprot:XP_003730885.1 PREDICTED: piggyBac transposable element-derived protein 4-like [Strongylocentrotus purpuratus]
MIAWSICDANTGYVQNWNISTGQEVLENDRGAMHQVVMDVFAGYLNIGHHIYIYMDNLFSSLSLFEELASKDTGACGTLRANRRGVPNDIKSHKPKKDDPPLVVKEGDITYISWADKRAVKLITSVHNGDTFIKEVRAKNDPASAGRISSLPFSNFFLQCCHCTSLNAMKPAHLRKRIEVNKVRLSIITGLLAGYEKPRAVHVGPRLEADQPLGRLTEKHFPANNPKRNGDGKPCFRDCEVCSNREGKRHQTSTVCRDCGNIPLCDKPCFRLYHTRRKYKTACTPAFHLEIDNVMDAEQ